ncbi:MAG: redox-sensing transcriptional repressor Rex [Clostridia bacterium]|nr:redox-sensing transcriptional repressor Rex [Clostridia bacterium]
MMRNRDISNSVIRRLPRYYRFLGELKSKGVTKISSGELSKRMGLTASQIRQDFNCFGEFGQQGYGYNVEMLQSEIGKILGLEKPKSVVLIGVGNLGRAVAQHVNFASLGYQLTGLFDQKESLLGQTVKDIPIRSISSLDEFCRENKPDVAVLCIPKSAANSIVEQLIKLGVKGFWNFSHYDIALEHPGISVENVHFSDSLMTLSYKLSNDNN